jgi:hypothetical protein
LPGHAVRPGEAKGGASKGAESERVAGFGKLEDGLRQAGEWYTWGPYVSERQWGTVRDDYSANGDAWDYITHEIVQDDPAWHDNLIFSEYFHGDNGAAIGAFHQTGWTGVVADLVRRRHGEVEAVGDVIRRIMAQEARE